jgi:hypothetical protein
VERLSVEQLALERAERKVKAALMAASTAGQQLLKDVIMGLVESREIAEDILWADRQALGADDAATMRAVSAKRRLVELQAKYAAKVKVACLEGLEFAGKMLEVRQMDVEGLTEEEIKVMEAQKKEPESKRREEASEVKKGAREARFRPYPAGWQPWAG